MSKVIKRNVQIDISLGKYKCISSYIMPENIEEWLECPNCGMRPLVWLFNNGRSTACGCGENEYKHFSISAESVGSILERCNGSAMEYNLYELRDNWNNWVMTGETVTHEDLRALGRW